MSSNIVLSIFAYWPVPSFLGIVELVVLNSERLFHKEYSVIYNKHFALTAKAKDTDVNIISVWMQTGRILQLTIGIEHRVMQRKRGLLHNEWVCINSDTGRENEKEGEGEKMLRGEHRWGEREHHTEMGWDGREDGSGRHPTNVTSDWGALSAHLSLGLAGLLARGQPVSVLLPSHSSHRTLLDHSLQVENSSRNVSSSQTWPSRLVCVCKWLSLSPPCSFVHVSAFFCLSSSLVPQHTHQGSSKTSWAT